MLNHNEQWGVEGVSCERFSADYAAAMPMNSDLAQVEKEKKYLVAKKEKRFSSHNSFIFFFSLPPKTER